MTHTTLYTGSDKSSLCELNDVNVKSISQMMTPKDLLDIYPPISSDFIYKSRQTVRNILNGSDNRKIIIVGPCSIHNIEEAKEYATELKKIQKRVVDKLFIIMRVYFEKPRTTVGWKGLINDPDLNGTCNANKGLMLARDLLVFLADLEMPAGCEFLDTFTPQYTADLITWGAIGARTSESQTHRQLVSGLSMPIGFKNGTGGCIQIALDAVESAYHEHSFYGIDMNGKPSIIQTHGNPDCHIILRGGKHLPNYYKSDVENIRGDVGIMIDCSHQNSKKDYKKQVEVWQYILTQHISRKNVKGFMLESNTNEGSQKIVAGEELKCGISVTDSCINLETTRDLIMTMYDSI